MIDASIALLKCVIDYGLCIWAFSWFAKRKSENRALFLGSIFLSSLFLFGINMLEIPWLNTIVSAFTLLVLFLVVFYTRWQQALPLALILVTLCVICEFTPPLIMSALIGNNLAQTIEITIDAAAFNLIASGIFYIVLRVGRFILNRIYGEKTPIYTKNNGWASIFPIVSIVFVYYIVYMGAVANTSQTTMMGGILYAFILISNICFFLGEVATEKRYLTAEEYKQMMFEQEKTEAVMNLQEQHLKEMKGLIHDFEAQLNGLQLLARENKSEAFKKSIEEVRESIQERNDFYFVESKALQLILNQTNELCIKYGIEFCADIRYGNFLFMTFPDVFSLFENALCNAVNACLQLGEEEKKRIELRVFRQHEQIVVLLANTYNKANTRSNTYALHPHHEHGYGIPPCCRSMTGCGARKSSGGRKPSCKFPDLKTRPDECKSSSGLFCCSSSGQKRGKTMIVVECLYTSNEIEEETILREQQKRCLAAAASYGWAVRREVFEPLQLSARGMDDRTGIQTILDDVCNRRFDLLMIASMDRLSYDKEEVKAFLAEMDLNGISIFNVGSNTVTLASGWDLMAFIRQMISPENGGDAQ